MNELELYEAACETLKTGYEKGIDYAKEFITNTPWMVSNGGNYWYFSYACSYLPKDDDCFNTFSNKKTSECAHTIVSWCTARYLTKAEEIKYLGVKS